MIRENIITAHRRLFGRCEGCNRRLGSYRPRVLGYEWMGWLSSEAGLWHLDCLERKLGPNGMFVYGERWTEEQRREMGGERASHLRLVAR